MLILTIRTDKPEAEIGLFDDSAQLDYEKWLAHRRLAETIHHKIEALLTKHQKDWHDIEAIACFKGPGSFTGLRIGLSVGNALSYGLSIPIVATQGKNWLALATKRLNQGDNDLLALPDYGEPIQFKST